MRALTHTMLREQVAVSRQGPWRCSLRTSLPAGMGVRRSTVRMEADVHVAHHLLGLTGVPGTPVLDLFRCAPGHHAQAGAASTGKCSGHQATLNKQASGNKISTCACQTRCQTCQHSTVCLTLLPNSLNSYVPQTVYLGAAIKGFLFNDNHTSSCMASFDSANKADFAFAGVL